MVGKTFKKAIAKAVASVITAALCAGCIVGTGFAAQPADTASSALFDYNTDVLSLVMDSAQEALKTASDERLVVSDYAPYLAVYQDSDAASEVVGKLYPGSYGEVVEKGDQWTKITSGEVTGYVLTADVAFGEEARALAQDIGKQVVKVTVDNLNIRSGPDFYSEVVSSGKKDETYRIVPEGSEYDETTGEIRRISEGELTEETTGSDTEATSDTDTVDSDTDTAATGQDTQQEDEEKPSYEEITTPIADAEGGQWYRIHLDDIYYGYVYADCVDVENQLDEAVTPEEEKAQKDKDAADMSQDVTDSLQTETDETQSTASQTTAASQTQQTESKQPQTQAPQTQETDAPETQAPQTQAPETQAPQTQAPETQAPSTGSTSDDAYLLACLVYCEAGNQSYEGQLAVANIVLNRVKSPLFPNTISEVIYQTNQFGPVYSGMLANALANGPTSSCVQAANDALAGNNNIGDLLFFNNYAPSDASTTVTIGDIVFYTYNY